MKSAWEFHTKKRLADFGYLFHSLLPSLVSAPWLISMTNFTQVNDFEWCPICLMEDFDSGSWEDSVVLGEAARDRAV